MQAGDLTQGQVAQWKTRVLVDGVERSADSWTVDRELSGDMPAQVVAGAGISAASGSITWSTPDVVSSAGDNPWNPRGWWPEKGAHVQVYVGDGTREWCQFTGVVDRTTGEVGGRMTSRLIDESDLLSAKVTIDPLLRQMPPAAMGGPYRYPNLVPTWHLDYALRQAGFFTTPAQEPNAVVSAPFAGGAWPHSGTLQYAGSYDGSQDPPYNVQTSWGYGITNATLNYVVRYTQPASVPVQLVLRVDRAAHTGTVHLHMNYDSGQWVRLHIDATGRPFVWTNSSGAVLNVCTLTAAQMAGATVVTAVVKGGTVTLRNDKGQTSSGTLTALSGTTDTVTMTATPGSAVGGMQVTHPTEPYMEHRPSIQWGAPSLETHKRRAVLDTSSMAHVSVIYAAPAVVSESAQSIIDEISGALLAAAWIDELGVLRWTTGLALREGPLVQTITTTDDVLALAWEDSLLGSRSGVTVTYRHPSISYSRYQMVEVWRGSSSTLESGDVKEDYITAGDDETWVGVGDDFTAVAALNAPDYNLKRGNYLGLTFTKKGAYYSPSGLDVTYGLEQIGPQAWQITHTIGTLPSGVTAETRTADADEYAPGLYSWNRNQALPLLSAGARVQWADKDISAIGAGGPGPTLEHDVGPWAAFDIAERIAVYLQGQTAAPIPTISNLEVVPDPRRQLGDKLYVSSPGLMGAQVGVMISGLSAKFGADGYSQSLSLRVINSSVLAQTYAQWNAADAAASYAAWTGGDTQTYTQFNQDG